MQEFIFNKTPLVFMTQSFWRDEAFSYLVARLPIFEILKTTASDFNPPLYYLILHFWMKFFGNSEVALRSLSLLFFAFNIYVFYLFLINILKIKTKRKFMYLLIFSLNPFLLYYGFEARMYSLFALLASLSFYFLLRGNNKHYFLANLLGLFTHYFFIFVLATQLIYLYFFEKELFLKKAKPAFLSLLLFSPWLIYILPKLFSGISETWILKSNFSDFFYSAAILLTGYEHKYYSYFSLQAVIITFAIFFLISYLRDFFKRNKIFNLLFLWSFAAFYFTFFISAILPIFAPRYLIFSAVGFNVLIFFVLERLNKKFFWLSILVLISTLIYYNMLQITYRRKENIRTKMSTIKILAGSKDLLYVRAPITFLTASYYFDPERVFVYQDDNIRIPNFIGAVLITKDKITSQPPIYPKKAFIIDQNYNYEVLSIL